MTWSLETSTGNESAKIAHLIVPYTRGRGLDVGCGRWKAWPHFIGVDSGKDYGGQRVSEIHADGDRLDMFADTSMDFVFSSHFLEHVVDFKSALAEWWRVIKPGGHLVLYLPHADFYPRIGQDGSNPDHKHDFLPYDIVKAMNEVTADTGCVVREDETRGGGDEYSFFQVYQKPADICADTCFFCYQPWVKPEKSCLVIRYGAMGDQIMASAIMPGLKAQGWHVTYQTTPKGQDILRENPHIDAFWVQDDNQVPNDHLGPYWLSLQERFDQIINLCEAVEGSLLTIPGRVNHLYSQSARHALFDQNYLERHAILAGVPTSSLMPEFHPSDKERQWAADERARMGKGQVILWTLAGSSIHKMWPWVDVGVAWTIKHTAATVVMVGGEREQELEQAVIDKIDAFCPKEAHGRVFKTCGRWSIRQTLAFASTQADMVIGPETGVLNAVSHLPIPKIVLLSHSSVRNLTRDWINTTSLTADVPCYPCHRLHYDEKFCHLDENSAAAICASAITPERVFGAIRKKLGMDHALKAAE